MKAGDRFLFDCENGYYCSYVLLEACGFWFLLDEKHGNLWCSPHYAKTPIKAFGGESWHKRFRKIPTITFEWHTFDEGDSSFDCLYALHENGKEVNVSVNCGNATELEYLLESNHSLVFSELEAID